MKYSIIIPHYNRPDLIVQTIKSFENLKDKEIIIVDDVSTQENIKKLKQNITQIPLDQNIKFYESNEKLFLAGARNKGVELSQGKWIFFIDDDDQATPKFIKFLNTRKLNENIIYRFSYHEIKINKIDKTMKWFLYGKTYSPQVSTFLISKKNYIDFNLRFSSKITHFNEDKEFLNIVLNSNIKEKYILKTPSIYYLNRHDHKSITKAQNVDALNWINHAYSISDSKYKKTIQILFLYNFLRNINYSNYYSNSLMEQKKILIKAYDDFDIKIKDIIRLDFYRLINYPEFKKTIKKYRKDIML